MKKKKEKKLNDIIINITKIIMLITITIEIGLIILAPYETYM